MNGARPTCQDNNMYTYCNEIFFLKRYTCSPSDKLSKSKEAVVSNSMYSTAAIYSVWPSMTSLAILLLSSMTTAYQKGNT